MSEQSDKKKNLQKRTALENKKKAAMIKNKKTNVKKLTKAQVIKIGLLMSLGILAATLLPSCAKTVDCPDQAPHAHYYVNEETGMGRYVQSEKETYRGLTRTEEKVHISEQDQKLLKCLDNNNLFSIGENQEAVQKLMDKEDYLEYEFSYTVMELMEDLVYVSDGNGGGSYQSTYRLEPVTYHHWTTDADLDYYQGGKVNFTGNKRIVQEVYHAYKVYSNEKGKIRVERSGDYHSLEEIPDGYNFINPKDYSKTVYDKNLEHIATFEMEHNAQTLDV